MCGIVGAVSNQNIVSILVDGLKRLEYRGYDSTGVAVIDANESLVRLRDINKVSALATAIESKQLTGHVGISHTRWATHGEPSVHNAHPHFSNDRIALVHNGIIENYLELKQKALQLGYHFTSETDTETVVHVLDHYAQHAHSNLEALQQTLADIKGVFSFGILFLNEPHRVYFARKGSPLVVGVGENANYIVSDPMALLSATKEFIFLNEGDHGFIEIDGVSIWDKNNEPAQRPITHSHLIAEDISKEPYAHFMLKEIHEQPTAVRQTIASDQSDLASLSQFINEKKINAIQIIACGTSFHAALIAKYWFEEFLQMPTAVEVASEFRYRKTAPYPNTLLIAVSQSGETADTLAALRGAKNHFLSTLAICNVPESAIMREADITFTTQAGIEIGVASTKAFSAQLTAFLMILSTLLKHLGQSNAELSTTCRLLPDLIQQTLSLEESIQTLASKLMHAEHALFIGRGTMYPIALEGALKLKEISYIHAEGYTAGELKHGPLALVTKNMPVIALAPENALFEKMASNIEEVRAREGKLIVLTSEKHQPYFSTFAETIVLPDVNVFSAPLVYTIPLQLLSYYIALLRGTNVDQPRNLAKSVTVE